METSMSKCVLISSTKNEGLYLLEWIAYHLTIGFDDIIIASNDDSDGSDRLLQALAENGWIHYVRNTVKDGESPQFTAYRRIHKHPAYQHAHYAMVLDADEFLNLKQHNCVQSFLKCYPTADAIAIFWRYYGSSGDFFWSDELVIDRFKTCATPFHSINAHFKTIFKVSENVKGLGIHKPLFDLQLFKSGKIRYEYVTKNTLETDIVTESKQPSNYGPGKIDTTVAQINHYSVKSLQEFEMRRNRGNGFNLSKEDHFSWRQFFLRDRNEVIDNSILTHKKQLQALIVRMLSEPDIQNACNKILSHYQNKFSQNIHFLKEQKNILYLQIFGERNTGTNWIQRIIANNYAVELIKGDEDMALIKKIDQDAKNIYRYPLSRMEYKESLRDLHWQKYNDISFGWKHGRPNLPFISRSALTNRVLFVCIIRNPYHWLLSFYKRPYHMFGETNKDDSFTFSKFIRSPWITRNREFTDKVLKNPIELWNTKVQSYFELQGIAPHTIICKYEDFLQNTSVIETLDPFLIRKTNNLVLKKIRPEEDLETYQEYLHIENIAEVISNEDIQFINLNLDHVLMNKAGYSIE
jgi:Glycosyl transferase family 2